MANLGRTRFPGRPAADDDRDITDLCKLSNGRFRIRTNMQMWDQICWQSRPADSPRAVALPLGEVSLSYRGFATDSGPMTSCPSNTHDRIRQSP
jgi:hypothetical protein